MKLEEQNCVDMSPALSEAECAKLLLEIPGWAVEADGKTLGREFGFSSYLAGADFVGLVAAMSQAQNHHPDIALVYKKVRVRYSTHSANGLTLNDFICAARAGALFEQRPA